ncbi:MAG: LysM peptidoglycan-binding domain-containing protein, partial [Sedimenticola sp.]|nr:LysM peptidoglycan-binding domain-containing protein [Sedimenticola sp.]
REAGMEGGDMVRKLSLAMALVLGVSPLTSYAVGLGDIQLKSALNQYLDAEIKLLSVDRDEISDIKVTLATPEAFRRSGIDRPFILSKLRFQADETADGKTIIRVSSRDPIREPFLNFLIEVNWPKGKILREYTVLLDPPVTLDRRPAPVQAAPMQQSRKPTQTARRPAAAPAARSAVSPSDVAWAGGAGPSEYGPTQKNDTLWGIAKQVRTEGASMQQMMIALQRANPQAFINQNINNLKVGQVLRIPKADEVMDLNRREAARAYSDQLQEWQADSKPTESVVEERPDSESIAAGEPEEPTVEPQAELKIASARPSGEGEAGPSEGADAGAVLEQLKQELIVSEESKEAALQEVETVRSRVDDLESQLEDLQRLLSLKSEQLAKLQSGMGDATAEAVTPEAMAETATELSADSPVMAETDEAAEPDAPVMAESGDSESDSMIKDLSLESSAEEPTQAEAESPVMAEEATPTTEEAAEEAPADEPAPVVAEAAPEPLAPAVSPEPAEEDNLLDMIAGDTTLLGVAVAGGVVILALLWVAISRRRSNSADFQESILISTVDENDSEQVMDEIPQEPVSHPTEETSFLSDFSPSDIDALQDETGEVDPLAEADVYIAYGRYQQAEELIRQAIDKFPERPELKHKLFEILYATKDKEGFVALAESSSAEGLDKKDESAWGKVITMGAQLAASHALFAGASDGSAEMDDDELASLEDELGLDNELGLDEVSTTVDLIDPDKTEELESIGSLDLDETSEFTELGDLDELSLDADLDSGLDELTGDLDMGLDLPSDEAEEVLSLEESDSLSVDADTDLSLVSPDSERVDEETSEFDMTLSHLDTDGLLEEEESSFSIEDPLETAELDDLRLDADSEAEQLGDAVIDFSDTAPMEGTDSQTYDSLELDQEEDAPLELADSFSLDDLDEDDGTDIKLGEPEDDLIDENNTKLDLARAYVDMEDADGARSILEEVLSEGNEGQKKEAQSLLDKLT